MHNTYYNHVTCNVQYPINNILQFTAYIANVYYAVYIYIVCNRQYNKFCNWILHIIYFVQCP